KIYVRISQLIEIISEGDSAYLQVRCIEISECTCILQVISASDTFRVWIFGSRILGSPVINLHVSITSVQQVHIITSAIQRTIKETSSLEHSNDAQIESFVTDPCIETALEVRKHTDNLTILRVNCSCRRTIRIKVTCIFHLD